MCIGGGAYRWSESLYPQLRGALQGVTAPVRLARVARSRLPCRIDVLTLLIEIDTMVVGREPHAKTTVERLHQLAGRGLAASKIASCSTATATTSSTGR
jgi:hypothetical protein